MHTLNETQHKKRMDNLKNAREDIKAYTRELRINNYLPGQIIYYLGDYPQKMSITPTEYDYNLLKSYAENGAKLSNDLFTTTSHTAENVKVFAVGKGSEYFNNKTVDNIDIANYLIDVIKG